MAKNVVKVGFISRIDYGSPGFRRGLVTQAYEYFHEKGVNYVVIAGGLLSSDGIKKMLKRTPKDEQQGKINEIAEAVAEFIPRPPAGKNFKTFIMISPAYDGPEGEKVARILTDLRPDVRYYSKLSERFIIDGEKKIAVVVPSKAILPSNYQSPAVDNAKNEELGRSGQDPAYLYAIGCYGVHFRRPGGESCESPIDYFGLPVLHKPERIKIAENQVGVVIAEVNDQIRIHNYSFRDLIRGERSFIKKPQNLTPFDEKVFTALRGGPITIGSLHDTFVQQGGTETREEIEASFGRLVELTTTPLGQKQRRNLAQISFDEDSRRYDFALPWLQDQLRYPTYGDKDVQEDRIVGFACMHAGARSTDYSFILKKLAKIIVQENATILAGVGDFIEGLKHDLPLRGEVLPAMNYTDQEQFAAELLASAMADAFEMKLKKFLKKTVNGKPSVEEVSNMVALNLIPFVYAEGNHDQWVLPQGYTPLLIFRSILLQELTKRITTTLLSLKLPLPNNLHHIVTSKLIASDKSKQRYALPSGIKMALRHPHMGRALTTTLRLEKALSVMDDCQVVLVGNFHTAVVMNKWTPQQGQRVGMQFGTIKIESDFESNMLKEVDGCIGVVGIKSRQGRIFETESQFYYVDPNAQVFSKDEFLVDFKRRYIGLQI